MKRRYTYAQIQAQGVQVTRIESALRSELNRLEGLAPSAAARESTKLARVLQEAGEELADLRAQVGRELVKVLGYSYAELAQELGVTRQRAHSIVARNEKVGS